MIKLNNLTLPRGLTHNPFEYSAMAQSNQMSVTGRVVIQRGKYQDGRQITLTGGADRCWLSLADAQAIAALREEDRLTLVINGTQYTVKFDLAQSDHLVINHLMADTYYIEKIRFIEVL